MVTLSSSVIKRDSRSVSDVTRELKQNGWNRTGSVLNGKLLYLENSGFSLTVADGPMGTLVFPSGPVRGRVFGNSGLNFGLMNTSSLGSSMPGPILPFGNTQSLGPSDTNGSEQVEEAEPRKPSGFDENPEQPNRKQHGEFDFV